MQLKELDNNLNNLIQGIYLLLVIIIFYICALNET
jgi:hypothetical protein